MSGRTGTPREEFRIAVLSVLDRTRAENGLNLGGIAMRMPMLGIKPASDELAREIDYLADKGFVALKEKAISPEVHMWKITAAGRDYLAEQGFE